MQYTEDDLKEKAWEMYLALCSNPNITVSYFGEERVELAYSNAEMFLKYNHKSK